MTLENKDDLIVIKKSKLKEIAADYLTKAYYIWISFQATTTMFWTRLFSGDSRVRILLESPAIVLFFNTLLFAFIGNLFGGLVGQIALFLTFLNIFLFCVEKLEWIAKLKK